MAEANRIERREAALVAWRRRAHEERGIPESALPTEGDLAKIARSAAMTEEAVATVPAAQHQRNRKWAKEIVAALVNATRSPMPVSDDLSDSATLPGFRMPLEPDPVPEPPAADWPPFVRYQPRPGRLTAPGGITAVAEEDDVLRYSWQPLSDGFVIYRVVSSDTKPPYDPDLADPVDVTQSTRATDDRPIRTARRYVQVWAHLGPDAGSAAAAQPLLVAEGTVIAPVREFRLGVTGSQVSGRWRPSDGVEKVLVLRLPIAVAGRSGPDFDQAYEICQRQDTSRGFVDEHCPPGTYEYRVYAGVRLGTLTLSPPRRFEVTVAEVLRPVLDLAVTAQGDGHEVRLDWSADTDQVEIYRTEQRPSVGVDDGPVEVSRLPSGGLAEGALKQPPDRDGTRWTVPRVPLPDITGIVYFTPVTMAGGRAQVGRSVAYAIQSLIRTAQVVERVHMQLVTFSWPAGADEVELHQTRRGQPLVGPVGSALDSIDYDGYLARGGMRVSAGQLPLRGCDLHLVPVTWYAAERLRGVPTTISYDGLLHIEYRLVGDGARRVLQRSLGRRVLEVRSERELTQLPFIVVYRSDRLPLSPGDGEKVLAQLPASVEAGVWTQLCEFRLRRRDRGWVRAFVDRDAPVIAVLDPPVRTLVV